MKRSLYLLLSALVVVSLALALTSCDLFGGGKKECTTHAYGEPTITADGHESKCVNCDDVKVIPHDFGAPDTKTASTCTVKGKGIEHCLIVGCTASREVELPLAAHEYTNDLFHDDENHWNECSVCHGKTNVTKHDFSATRFDDKNHWTVCECTEVGTTEAHHLLPTSIDDKPGYIKYVCSNSNCKYELTNPDELDPNHVHTWDAGKITTEPTHTETGLKTFTCTVCKGTKTEDVNALGHDFNTNVYVDNKDGHHSKKCSCGAVDTVKTDHEFGSPVRDGDFEVYTCVCGAEKKEPVEGYIDPNGWTKS